MKKQNTYIIAACVAAIAVMGFISIKYGDSDTPAAATVESPQPSIKPSATTTAPSPTPSEKPKTDWAKVDDMTKDTVRAALSEAHGGLAIKTTTKTLTDISVLGGDIVLDVKPETMEGGRIYTRQIGESMLAYSKVLFKNPQVERVVLNGHVDTTDGDTVYGAQIVWTRDTYEKVDYDDLETKALGDISAPYRAGESYTLKPIVLNELKDKDRAYFE